jgi:hypothetical protein
MKDQFFSLVPFQEDIISHSFNIGGCIARSFNSLFIRYELLGELSEIVIPERAGMPIREGRLWDNTCFEFFVAIKGLPQYWEFNLSPSEDWNVFRFKGYRNKEHEGEMEEEPFFSSLPFRTQREPESFLLELECNLDNFIREEQSLDIGISAVIKYRNNAFSYWAIAHCGSVPDFHLRESFIITL